MKKIIALIITALLLVSCFSLSISAAKIPDYDYSASTNLKANINVSFSEDFKTLYYGQTEYVAFDNSHIYNSVSAEMLNDIELTAEQNEKISAISLTASREGALIDATIKYKDGISMNVHYIKAQYIEECNGIINSTSGQCVVDFEYPQDNQVTVSRDKLSGDTVTLNRPYNSAFYVFATTADKQVCVIIGSVIVYNDEFYYLDFNEIGSSYADYDIYSQASLKAQKITDPDTLAALEEAQQRNYDDDYGFLFDDDFTKSVADIFLVILFVVAPFAVFVLFLILGIRAKGVYKKFDFAIASLCAAEIIIFTIIALLVK